MTGDITAWDAWQRGLDRAIQQLAEATVEPVKPRQWPTRTHIDPPVFCEVANCGLTVTDNSQYCWQHTAPETTAKGLL